MIMSSFDFLDRKSIIMNFKIYISKHYLLCEGSIPVVDCNGILMLTVIYNYLQIVCFANFMIRFRMQRCTT